RGRHVSPSPYRRAEPRMESPLPFPRDLYPDSLPRSARPRAELLELLGAVRVRAGIVERDEIASIELVDRLIHGLHAEAPARLDDRVQLVHLVVADESANGGRRDHDLDREHAPSSIRPGQELLAKHTLEAERELGADL